MINTSLLDNFVFLFPIYIQVKTNHRLKSFYFKTWLFRLKIFSFFVKFISFKSAIYATRKRKFNLKKIFFSSPERQWFLFQEIKLFQNLITNSGKPEAQFTLRA